MRPEAVGPADGRQSGNGSMRSAGGRHPSSGGDEPRPDPDPRDFGPIAFEGLEKEGTEALRRRIFRTELILVAVTLLVAVVLVFSVQVRVVLGDGVAAWASVYVIVGVLVPLTHGQLALLARRGRLVEVRHWTWLLFPVHLVWGSGVLVAVWEAVPIGIGLALLDLMVHVWLRDVAVP